MDYFYGLKDNYEEYGLKQKYYHFVLTGTIFLEVFSFSHTPLCTPFSSRKQNPNKLSAHSWLPWTLTPD